MTQKVNIHNSWKEVLQSEFERPYFKELTEFVRGEIMTKTIYPHPKNIFAAFEKTPFDKVRVVILGQDPYHNPGEAHGLCFSVQEGICTPPSLKNIYKEITQSTGIQMDMNSGDLTHWAEQGILLLNAVLTVPKNQPAGHAGKGWEDFTDAVIWTISEQKERVIFLLWGSYAQKKWAVINRNKHVVLSAPHPSPLAAHRGFFGCNHFVKVNEVLKERGEKEIEWGNK